MTERERLRAEWQIIAEALSIQFVAPFTLILPSKKHWEFAGLLPQFGGPHGMLIDAEYDNEAFSAAIASGFCCTSMLAESHHLPVDPENYIDCLADWGWFGTGQAPEWCLDKPIK